MPRFQLAPSRLLQTVAFSHNDVWYSEGAVLYRRHLKTLVVERIFKFSCPVMGTWANASQCIVMTRGPNGPSDLWEWPSRSWLVDAGTDAVVNGGYAHPTGEYWIDDDFDRGDTGMWIVCKSRTAVLLERLLGATASQLLTHA